MNPIIQEKINRLRKEYTDSDSNEMLNDIEKRLRDNIKRQKIPEMGIIIEIVEAGNKIIEEINFILTNTDDLSEKERDKLIVKRKVHEFYISRLSGEHEAKRIAAMEKFLDERIKIIGDTNP